MSESHYEPDDRDLHPPQLPMDPVSRTIRFLNYRFPKTYAALTLAPRTAIAMAWMSQLERSGAGRRLSRLDFGERRTSDTAFVLGTGASINDYTAAMWRVVDAHDSIAMNFFLLHEHVPSYHIMEDVHGIRTQLLDMRYREIGDYQDVPLIVKTQLSNLSLRRVRTRVEELHALPDEVRHDIYLSLDVLAAGTTVEDMESAYRTLARWGLWTPKDKFLTLTKRRGSVSYAMNLAVRAGYKNIVLCGIDLNHTEYFYDSRRRELEAKGLPVPINDEEGPVHSTNDPENNPVTMHEVIVGIKRVILDPHGIALSVASDTSALHPDLPLYDWAAGLAAIPNSPPGSSETPR